MPQGGVLLDGNGDIALCDSALESVRDIVRSRLKADLNGWQLYPIGADLQSQIGEMAPDELESAVRRLVRTALSRVKKGQNDQVPRAARPDFAGPKLLPPSGLQIRPQPHLERLSRPPQAARTGLAAAQGCVTGRIPGLGPYSGRLRSRTAVQSTAVPRGGDRALEGWALSWLLKTKGDIR
jgi:hypothetical protein